VQLRLAGSGKRFLKEDPFREVDHVGSDRGAKATSGALCA
jgi:hypothetical protein